MKVTPMFDNKFYVYCLCKPCGTPFYVGKGIGGRINVHFYKCNLKHKNPKNNTINKYGSSIRREILCYFDNEDSAYDYEEYLISHYGLRSEGGILTNYAKTRFQYSDRFFDDVVSKSKVENKKKLPSDIVVKIFTLFFYHNKSYSFISKELNISFGVIVGVIFKKRYKHLYDKYITSGLIKNRRKEIPKDRIAIEKTRKVTDDLLIKYHEDYRLGRKTIKNISSILGVNDKYLSNVFNGNGRAYLNLKAQPILFLLKDSDKYNIDQLSDIYLDFKINNLRVSDVRDKYGIPFSTATRICRLERRYGFIEDYMNKYKEK